MTPDPVAVLGVGMHPWGKWGRNFVEYGRIAAREALADAGIEWTDVDFVAGADTMRNGYPGYVSGATFAQALGWTGSRVASCYAACASGSTALEAAERMLSGLRFDRDRLADAAADEMVAATDLADLLVRRGMPFREAHGVVGGLVRAALESGRSLSELTADEVAQHSELLGDEYHEVLASGAWLDSKVSAGGTSASRLGEQLEAARAALDSVRTPPA